MSILAEDPALPRCVTRYLFTYSLGRAPRAGSGFDDKALEAAATGFVTAGQLFPTLVKTLVLSDAFRTREDEVVQ